MGDPNTGPTRTHIDQSLHGEPSGSLKFDNQGRRLKPVDAYLVGPESWHPLNTRTAYGQTENSPPPSTRSRSKSSGKRPREGAPNRTRNRGRNSDPSASSTTRSSQGANKRQRKTRPDRIDQDGDDSDSSLPSKSSGSTSKRPVRKYYFKCPYYLHSPNEHPGCAKWPKEKKAISFMRLKGHVLRTHERPEFCEICYDFRAGEVAQIKKRHQKSKKCRSKRPEEIEKMTPLEQQVENQAKERSRGNLLGIQASNQVKWDKLRARGTESVDDWEKLCLVLGFGATAGKFVPVLASDDQDSSENFEEALAPMPGMMNDTPIPPIELESPAAAAERRRSLLWEAVRQEAIFRLPDDEDMEIENVVQQVVTIIPDLIDMTRRAVQPNENHFEGDGIWNEGILDAGGRGNYY